MLRAAGRVIVVADSSKFGRKSLTLVTGLAAIDLVVSDSNLSSEWQREISAAGPRLVLADVADEPETAVLPAAMNSVSRRSHRA